MMLLLHPNQPSNMELFVAISFMRYNIFVRVITLIIMIMIVIAIVHFFIILKCVLWWEEQRLKRKKAVLFKLVDNRLKSVKFTKKNKNNVNMCLCLCMVLHFFYDELFYSQFCAIVVIIIIIIFFSNSFWFGSHKKRAHFTLKGAHAWLI